MSDNHQFGRKDYDVSVIIRAYGSPELTDKCISSLEPIKDRAHAIVVDQEGCWEHWARVHNKKLDHATHITTPANMGAVRATNLGLQVAMLDPSEFVLVLDNDAEIPEGDSDWLDRWLKHFEPAEIGAAGATTDYVSGPQHIHKTRRSYTKPVDDANEGGPGMSGPLEVPFLISFACMYRKLALRMMVPPAVPGNEVEALQAGRLRTPIDFIQGAYLWDERFEPGNSEDLDVSMRMRACNWTLVVARDVYVHHVGSQAFGKDLATLVQRNVNILAEKWGRDMLVKYGLAERQTA